MISERKACNILLTALVRNLHRLQDDILRMERFGEHAVTDAMQRLGIARQTTTLAEKVAEHAELAEDIKKLKAGIDKARDEEWAVMVQAIRRKHAA